MKPFLWTILVIYVLGVFANIRDMARGRSDKPMTEGVRGIIVVVGIVIIVWAAILLSSLY